MKNVNSPENDLEIVKRQLEYYDSLRIAGTQEEIREALLCITEFGTEALGLANTARSNAVKADVAEREKQSVIEGYERAGAEYRKSINQVEVKQQVLRRAKEELVKALGFEEANKIMLFNSREQL